MVLIREQQDNPDCRYQAQVWLKKHSQQCGCFVTRKAAEVWANTLRARIIAADTIKALRHPAGY